MARVLIVEDDPLVRSALVTDLSQRAHAVRTAATALDGQQALQMMRAVTGADQPARVPVPRSDLAAVADALIGNVFRHTGDGTGFAVTLHSGDGVTLILFADAGPGIADPDAALRRGSSGAAPPASAWTSPAGSPSRPAAG